jgi:hypothetical protein
MKKHLEFRVNDRNDQLLFDYVCGKVTIEEKKELEYLISTSEVWKEYFLDMKWVYETFGENGLELSKKLLRNDLDQTQCSSFHKLIITLKEKLNAIKKFFQLNKVISKSDLRTIYKDLENISDSLSNIPIFELSGMEIDYIITSQLLISNLTEFKNRASETIQIHNTRIVSELKSQNKNSSVSSQEILIYEGKKFKIQV